jgi:hypothetical protein
MQLDLDYIPSPIVNDRLSSRFHIPITMNIAYDFDFISHVVPYGTFAASFRSLKMESYSLFYLIEIGLLSI